MSTALELQAAVTDAAQGADVVVMAAAVADYRPADVSESKIKKDASDAGSRSSSCAIPDILAGLGHAPHDGTLLVGFAAETEPDDDRLLELGAPSARRRAPTCSWSTGSAGTRASRPTRTPSSSSDATAESSHEAHGTKCQWPTTSSTWLSQATTAAVAADTPKEHEPTT